MGEILQKRFNELFLPVQWVEDKKNPGVLDKDEIVVHPTLQAINAYRAEKGLPPIDPYQLAQLAIKSLQQPAEKQVQHPLLTADLATRKRIRFDVDITKVPAGSYRTAVAELVKAAAFADLYFALQADPNYVDQLDAVIKSGDILRLRHFWQSAGHKCIASQDAACSSLEGMAGVPTDPNGVFWPDEFTTEDLNFLKGAVKEGEKKYEWPSEIIKRRVLTPGSSIVACSEGDVDAFLFKGKWYRPVSINTDLRIQLVADKMAAHFEKAAEALSSVNPEYSKFLRAKAAYFRDTPIFDDPKLDELWVKTDDPMLITAFGSIENYGALGSPDGLKAMMQGVVAYIDPQMQAYIESANKLITAFDDKVWGMWTEHGEKFPIRRLNTNPPEVTQASVIINTGAMNAPGYVAGGFNQPNYDKTEVDLPTDKQPKRTVMYGPLVAARIENQGLPVALKAFDVPSISQLEQVIADIPAMIRFVHAHEENHQRIITNSDSVYVPSLGKTTSLDQVCGDKHMTQSMEEAKADLLGLLEVKFLEQNKVMTKKEREASTWAWFGNVLRDINLGATDEHGRGAVVEFYLAVKHGAIKFNPETKKYSLDVNRLNEKIDAIVKEHLDAYLSFDRKTIEALDSAAQEYLKTSPLAGYIAEVQAEKLPKDNLPYYLIKGDLGQY